MMNKWPYSVLASLLPRNPTEIQHEHLFSVFLCFFLSFSLSLLTLQDGPCVGTVHCNFCNHRAGVGWVSWFGTVRCIVGVHTMQILLYSPSCYTDSIMVMPMLHIMQTGGRCFMHVYQVPTAPATYTAPVQSSVVSLSFFLSIQPVIRHDTGICMVCPSPDQKHSLSADSLSPVHIYMHSVARTP